MRHSTKLGRAPSETWTIFDRLAVAIATAPDRPRQSVTAGILSMLRETASTDIPDLRLPQQMNAAH
jgi:hypothetical protein